MEPGILALVAASIGPDITAQRPVADTKPDPADHRDDTSVGGRWSIGGPHNGSSKRVRWLEAGVRTELAG